jgi:uncharacterized protein (TIGR00251 family)
LIRSTPAGVEIDVRVIPRARKTTIDGERADAVLVRVAAPPVDDAANEELIRYFAGTLGLPRSAVRVVSGRRGRKKRLALDGAALDSVREFIRGIHDR